MSTFGITTPKCQSAETASDIAKKPETFTQMIDLVLRDESANRFKARMEDKDSPITMKQIMDVLPWLMEKYGLRPSEPSSTSSPGFETPDDGTNSTDKPLELVSIPSGFPRTDS